MTECDTSAPTTDRSEHRRIYMRAWYQRNKERARASNAKWRARNPEKARASALEAGRRFRERNPRKTAESWKRYAERHPEKRKEQTYRWREKFPARHLMAYTRARANREKREFTLTEAWIAERLLKGCEISGLTFDMSRPNQEKGRRIRAPSIDRIECSRGYTPDSCRLICVGLNLALQDWGLQAALGLWKAVVARAESGEL